jgi:hypothetical protein
MVMHFGIGQTILWCINYFKKSISLKNFKLEVERYFDIDNKNMRNIVIPLWLTDTVECEEVQFVLQIFFSDFICIVVDVVTCWHFFSVKAIELFLHEIYCHYFISCTKPIELHDDALPKRPSLLKFRMG